MLHAREVVCPACQSKAARAPLEKEAEGAGGSSSRRRQNITRPPPPPSLKDGRMLALSRCCGIGKRSIFTNCYYRFCAARTSCCLGVVGAASANVYKTYTNAYKASVFFQPPVRPWVRWGGSRLGNFFVVPRGHFYDFFLYVVARGHL